MRIIKKIIIFLIVAFCMVYAVSLFAPKTKQIEYGVTFSAPYAEGLGLEWKKVYTEMFKDLKPKYIRLSAYWNSVEKQRGEIDFSDLDFQVDEAVKNNAKIVIGVGRRLPRWPECHDPQWIKGLSQSSLKNAQLSYVEAVVTHFSDRSNVIAWQVENEPFLSTFGICPQLDTEILDAEINLVKKLDPVRPVIITDSGELSFWMYSGARGDIFGTTFYRYVFSDVFKRYWTNHIPALYYRFKGGMLSILHPGKPIVIMELEAEPWTTKGIPNTPIDEQFKTMGINNFETIVKIAGSTGFSPQYLWGVEWWYWMKEKGHPEFWNKAAGLFQK